MCRPVLLLVALLGLGGALSSASANGTERPYVQASDLLGPKDKLVVKAGQDLFRSVDVRLVLTPGSPCPPFQRILIMGRSVPPASEIQALRWTETAKTEPTANPDIERLVPNTPTHLGNNIYRFSKDWVRHYRGDSVVSVSNRLYAMIQIQAGPGIRVGYISDYDCFFSDGQRLAKLVTEMVQLATQSGGEK